MIVYFPRGAGLALAAGLGMLVASAGGARAFGQDRAADSVDTALRIVDSARMFDSKAIEQSKRTLHGWSVSEPVTIETVDSIGGRTIEEATTQHARRSGKEGLYVLIAKKERKIDVQVAGRLKNVVTEKMRKEIQDAFIQGLRQLGPDEGLSLGIAVIRRSLTRDEEKDRNTVPLALGDIGTSRPALEGETGRPLVVRNQVRLTLGGARQIIEAAEAKAAELKLKMNIAVVDDGGHLLAFARMDGARPASGYTAMTKAATAATFRQETGALPRGGPPDQLLNISLQNAALASGGKLTTLLGGVPVLVDGQVIGGVGVGGGTGEQDAIVAKAGLEALARALPKAEKPAER